MIDARRRHDELLINITRCPNLVEARTDPSHSCAEIVRSQSQSPSNFQVPEPWSGHIDTAPILFVGSNPSIGEDDEFPTSSWSKAKTVCYFQRRFDEGCRWVTKENFNKVRYWTGVRARAKEILGCDAAIAGKHFALTEVVHCKSKGEAGVGKARSNCVQMWLDKLMAQSKACVVVLLGAHARHACATHWEIEDRYGVHFDVYTKGRRRTVVILPHPNARMKKKLAYYSNSEELRRLHADLSHC